MDWGSMETSGSSIGKQEPDCNNIFERRNMISRNKTYQKGIRLCEKSIFVNLLKDARCVFRNECTPIAHQRKKVALEKLTEKYNAQTNQRLTPKQILKKLNNTKNRIRANTMYKKNHNNKYELKPYDKMFLELWKGSDGTPDVMESSSQDLVDFETVDVGGFDHDEHEDESDDLEEMSVDKLQRKALLWKIKSSRAQEKAALAQVKASLAQEKAALAQERAALAQETLAVEQKYLMLITTDRDGDTHT